MEDKKEEGKKPDENLPKMVPGTKMFELDEKNKICCDCQKEEATNVSLNQGITLCTKCCEHHMLLGPAISSLRLIEGNWFEYPFKYMEQGGNTKFLKFLEDNLIPLDKEPEIKYKCKAVDYYRRNLKAHVIGLGDIVKDYDKPMEIADIKNVFPEFSTNEKKKESIGDVLKEGGLKVAGFFKNIGEKTKEGVLNLGNKTAENAKMIGEKTAVGLKTAGTFVATNVNAAYENVKGKIVKNDENKDAKPEQGNTNAPATTTTADKPKEG